MGDNGSLSRAQCSVLFWAFLQADCEECPQEYYNELLSLGKGFTDPEASLSDSICSDLEAGGDLETGGALEAGGDLETDGHLSIRNVISLEGIEPSVDVLPPENIRLVAAELRDIAAQLELNVVARATQNLTKNILGSSVQHWKDYLHKEVHNLLTRGVGLDNLHQERVVAALAFTLVKGVCLQAPSLIRSLFDTTMQYLSHGGGR